MNISDLYTLYCQAYLVSTDSRSIPKNALFFALKGANFNGNTFASKALALGASYAIVDEKAYQTEERIILVPDVLQTLQALANYHRRQLNIPIIGLTGSNGKTTTKELIHAVLSTTYATQATKGNLNNHIGVPLSLLSITPAHEIAIIEMGANHQKEIAFLSSLCEPDYGYITNFGKAHLEGFGGVEGVIKGKSELYTYLLEHQKTAIVNPEDAIQVAKTAKIASIPFDSSLQFINAHPFVRVSYQETIIQSQLIGGYNYANMAAAITIGKHFKVALASIKDGIENYVPSNNRSQILTKGSNTIILDAYNANPSSMKVALENFAAMKSEEKVIILGDMFELGEDAAQEHQAIVDLANSLAIEQQFFVGSNFYKTQTAQQQFASFEELKAFLEKKRFQDTTLLIKGSRGMQLERLLDLFD